MAKSNLPFVENIKSFLKSDKFKDNSQFFIVAALILMAVIISFAMKFTRKSIEVSSSDNPVLQVEILKVEAAPAKVEIFSSAAVEARGLVNISPEVGGKVLSVSRASYSGSSFKAGEVLFEIDPSDYQFKLDMAKARLKGARRDLMLAKADSESARSEWSLVNPDQKAPPLVAKVPQLLAAGSALEAAEAEVKKG